MLALPASNDARVPKSHILMRTTAARLSPILALFSLFFLTRCSGVVGESGLPGDPISGDGGSGDNGGGAGARGLGGTIVTGSGGNAGNGIGGAGQGAGGGGVVASGIPCDVQALLQTRCVMCHASPPVNGAPMPLVSFANLIAASFVDPTKTFAQRALARIQQTAGQMPPAPNAARDRGGDLGAGHLDQRRLPELWLRHERHRRHVRRRREWHGGPRRNRRNDRRRHGRRGRPDRQRTPLRRASRLSDPLHHLPRGRRPSTARRCRWSRAPI